MHVQLISKQGQILKWIMLFLREKNVEDANQYIQNCKKNLDFFAEIMYSKCDGAKQRRKIKQ